jgi:hypothetical protein
MTSPSPVVLVVELDPLNDDTPDLLADIARETVATLNQRASVRRASAAIGDTAAAVVSALSG